MITTAADFADHYFRKLEELDIPYVIIHSYETIPQDVSGDIDYAVLDPDLPRLTAIQEDLGRKHNWRVVQSFRHGVFAYYNVMISLDDPTQILKLDACSSYARARRLLVRNNVLLDGRRRHASYWIPAPSAEFIYEVTKLFDAKLKDPARYLPKLKALWELDKEGAQQHFNEAFGDTGLPLDKWFARKPSDWLPLRDLMLSRNRFGLGLLLREAVRILKRVSRPTGMHVTLIGSDGSGKSTLISHLQRNLGDFFRRFKTYHFRVRTSGGSNVAVIDPHGKPPYGMIMSMAKLVYYFIDCWISYLLKLIRLKIESTLIVFDRDFDDILVDPKRYRLSSNSISLASVLRKFLPRPDITFALDLDPAVCYARKPELTIEELERQRGFIRELAAAEPRYILIRADEKPDDVARTVSDAIIQKLLKRRGEKIET